ncbi:MAG: hypothetical protein DLM55_02525 [Acidimicrobiales bacterium]|nr:MAG: hypothetical protein DLM55_02525 [Acidimicrobiales bacterium]
MAKDKVTITLEHSTVAAVKEATKRHGLSFSSLADQALRHEILRADMALLAAAGYIGSDSDWYDTIDLDRDRERMS